MDYESYDPYTPLKRGKFDHGADESPDGPSPVKMGGEGNSNLNVGTALNRTFVLRGSKVGVFKHNDEDQLEYINKIPTIKTLDGEEFQPHRTMLHNQDEKMLMLRQDQQDTVYVMDLHRGEIVEEWVSESRPPANRMKQNK